ncbi:Prepilin peptidase [Shewanella halifaxensis HAW-EB4]|uniref:Prepilin leader peptidase/N-methyltransferase n=1 Tax=Shewanella halifaxensis (strain HAW-EB4) TaxID=458817 RepID=B0TQQ0_SHEHH|nr:A24 family peptidase [Shewanella halifaxensis]ABZ75043.1 Prepilin peptidase [Shewanella halifaxensis HAW-EB4]
MTELISVFGQNPWLFIALSFVFAAVIGSFLNVVIHRMPVMMKRDWQQECNHYLSEYKKEVFDSNKKQLEAPIDAFPEKYNLVVPGSACPKCKANIKAVHNLPILGWLMLKGKCATCSTKISPRYPIVELITGALVAFLAWHFGPTLEFALTSLLTFCLVALTGIDLDEMLLPDQITLPLLWLGLIINLSGTFATTSDALIGAAAGYLSLWSVFWLFKLLTGKDGMGYGDFKLLAVFGAWFGWQVLPLVILLSSLVGAVVGIALIVFKKLNHGNPIPFGPYIAAAGWIAMIWGESITNWYLSTL